MGQELSGKVAVITGGANGIGRAIVELFMEEGAKVVAADIDETRGKELLKTPGGAIQFIRSDVTREEDIQALVDFAVGEFGALHVMVNNAGVPSNTPPQFLDLDFKDFQRVMNLNVLSVMLGTQRAARHMAGHGGGSIINMSSTAGLHGGGGPMTYRASKAAVIQLTKSTAIDLARHHIRVNCLAPYNIATKIILGTLGAAGQNISAGKFQELDDVYRRTMMAVQPLKRQGVVRDVANAALFYASDRSLQVTGTVLPVDGGYTAGDPVDHAEIIVRARTRVMAQT